MHVAASDSVSEQVGAEDAVAASKVRNSREARSKSADEVSREEREDREMSNLVRDLASSAFSDIHRGGVHYAIYYIVFLVTFNPFYFALC